MNKTISTVVMGSLIAAIALAAFVRADDKVTPTPQKAKQRPVSAAEAQSYFRQQEWAKAVAAYEQVVRVNPHDGQNWQNYGFALHSLKRYDEAIKAWTKSVEVGYQPATGLYNVACANSLSGHKDAALAFLQKAIDAGFSQEELIRTDTDLDPIRQDPRFKKIIGTPPEGLSREERWRYDLYHLVRRMEKVHYNLYAKVSREKFQEAVNELKGRISTLKDEEMAVGIQRILALVGDGHTLVVFRRDGELPKLRYPVELYLFKEGLYVRAASPEMAGLVGSKVLQIGKASAEEALAAVAPLCSRDNAMGVKKQSPVLLTIPAALSYLKIADDMTHVALLVKKPDGLEATMELKPTLIDQPAVKKFIKANASAKTPEPLSFKKNDERFWFEYVPQRKLVYFQFNAVANKPDETLEKFSGRLFAFINQNPVEHLIIDMRNNGGGNNFLNRPLVHGLIRSDKVNRPGHLFVLVGRRTFSAAMNCTVDIERNTHALFVGEPTGSSPNFVGETTILVLPCSGLRFSCSSLYWQSSTAMDRRNWIAPALAAEPSIEAFAANRDPGLEAIFAYLDAEPEAPQRSGAAEAAPNGTADEQSRFTPPPGEETDEAKRLIDQAQMRLKSGKSTTDIFTDPAYLGVHQWPRFRNLLRDFAQSSQATIVTPAEPGVPMVVTGRVIDLSGRPVKGAMVYVYHTSAKGWYSDRAAHIAANEGDRKYAQLFGYLCTDDRGNFQLRTIRPAGYPDADLPAHIHVEVGRPDRRPGNLVTEIQFDDDPRFTPEWRRRSHQERFVIAKVDTDARGVQQVRVELTGNW
jgi:protocatechuate 3,4-dioxygenase beta subunit/tetratricopeptide (TPR) repeat protein